VMRHDLQQRAHFHCNRDVFEGGIA